MELPTYTAQDQVPPLANTHVEVERLRRFLISRLFWDYDIKLPREYDLSNHDWCHYVRLAQMLYRMGSMGDSQDWGQCDAQRMERSAYVEEYEQEFLVQPALILGVPPCMVESMVRQFLMTMTFSGHTSSFEMFYEGTSNALAMRLFVDREILIPNLMIASHREHFLEAVKSVQNDHFYTLRGPQDYTPTKAALHYQARLTRGREAVRFLLPPAHQKSLSKFYANIRCKRFQVMPHWDECNACPHTDVNAGPHRKGTLWDRIGKAVVKVLTPKAVLDQASATAADYHAARRETPLCSLNWKSVP